MTDRSTSSRCHVVRVTVSVRCLHRFFTQRKLLRYIADKLNAEFLKPDSDVYVDFSCGTNEFGAMLSVKHFIGFDIFPSSHFSCRDHFRCGALWQRERPV